MTTFVKNFAFTVLFVSLFFMVSCDGLDDVVNKSKELADDLGDNIKDGLDELEEQTEIGKELIEIDPSEVTDDAIEEVGDFDVSDFGGGAESESDSGDSKKLAVVQYYPKDNGNVYPGSVVQIFFDDVILISSLDGAVEVTRSGDIVEGEINLNPDKLGGSILTFSPRPAFQAGETYNVKVRTSLRDNGGNSLEKEINFDFTVKSRPDGYCDGNFESVDGLVFEGDGAVISGTTKVPAPSGKYAGISTSEGGALSGNSAIDKITSRMTCFPDSNVSKLIFKYNFVSGEFNEWVDSAYDDTAMIVITDTEGKTISQTITSIKGVGKKGNSDAGKFYGIENNNYNNDNYVGQTGWKTKEITFARVLTPPVTITFSVQDVADTYVDSVLIVDEMTYE